MVSLWLVPNARDSERLKPIMSPQHDARDLVSAFSYPAFEPHVTLASIPPRPLSEIRRALPTSFDSRPPIKIQFASVDTGDHYFRSVYISVKPTLELLALHTEFHEKIGVPPKTPSFPHCSICYIGDEDAQNGEKERFVAELKQAGKVRDGGTVLEQISVRCGDNEEDWMSEWKAAEIWVVQCVGPVPEWKVLDRIPILSEFESPLSVSNI